MSIRALESLRDMLCEELEEIASKGELSAGTLDTVDKLTHTIKNIDKIMMYEEHSHASDWEADGHMRGNSYRRSRDSIGRYSRDDGYSRGGYSRDSETEHMIEQLEDMMKTAGGESEHMALKKAIGILKNA